MAAEQGWPLRADGRHDRAEVVHLVLEHVPAHPAVRQAAARPVEQDQPENDESLPRKLANGGP
jgi:hypothetical protein